MDAKVEKAIEKYRQVAGSQKRYTTPLELIRHEINELNAERVNLEAIIEDESNSDTMRYELSRALHDVKNILASYYRAEAWIIQRETIWPILGNYPHMGEKQ